MSINSTLLDFNDLLRYLTSVGCRGAGGGLGKSRASETIELVIECNASINEVSSLIENYFVFRYAFHPVMRSSCRASAFFFWQMTHNNKDWRAIASLTQYEKLENHFLLSVSAIRDTFERYP